PADDAEFLRRAYLDLTGRIPSVAEARDFLADPRPDRRRRLIEALLQSPEHAGHFTALYRDLLLPGTPAPAFARRELDEWLRGHASANTPSARWVREWLTPRLDGPLPAFRGGPRLLGPGAFFSQHGFKAENLAATTSRVFLGVDLDCARCHDHKLVP